CRNDRTISQHKPRTRKDESHFRQEKPEAPPVNISDVGGKVDARVTGLDMKIEKLDQELRKYREQMKKTRGPPGTSCRRSRLTSSRRRLRSTHQETQSAPWLR
ncbi:Charged multivesicular body protein 5, partial [Phytophthora cinnamomi]|uniref:Charged multivesicular body protein 5 n=1 Tax=Phytophthora cinnamomi TaxID=4785 RepID=UPI00355A50EB